MANSLVCFDVLQALRRWFLHASVCRIYQAYSCNTGGGKDI